MAYTEQINIDFPGTAAEAAAIVRSALKQNLGHINAITGGEFDEADVDAAGAGMLTKGLSIMLGVWVRDAARAWDATAARQAAGDAVGDPDVTVPTDFS